VLGEFVFGGNLSLRTYDGKHFICAENGGGRELIANRTSADIWETFKIVGPNGKTDGSLVQNGDKISFQTYDGTHYVCAEGGGGRELVANRTEAHEWETFTVQFASTSATPTPTMRIIHISDPHFTDSSITFDAPIDFQNSSERSKNLALYLQNHISQLGTNIIVITGDLTDSGDPGDYEIARDFIQKLKNSGFFVYAIPGNHDYCKEGLLSNFIITGGKDNSRRQRFIDYIDSITYQSSQYPQVINLGICKLILLDSMQAEMNEDTGDNYAQGKLGENQLSALKQLLAGYEQQRKNGTKVIVALHHHPFKPTNDNGGLDDAQQFLEIIANKIDCLLFGHSTPNPDVCQQTFPDEEVMYGIPLINVENMEHMEYSTGKITVVDLGYNCIEAHSTDESKPIQIIPGKTPAGIHITPVVSRYTAVYNYSDVAPVVKFQSGDLVNITIGGGVQTGGKGKTWKRYINPSGSNSDRFYFGQIYIPGITSTLTPIRDLVPVYGGYDSHNPDKCTLQFTIPNINDMPEFNQYLSIGYVDDVYSDNGYWGHDDGTEDQCKNIGPAYVDISIQHQEIPSTKTTLQFTISPPVVNKETPIVYNGSNANPIIDFKQGDKVTIVTGGGVQTGGKGKTWKRYVNPSGSNSDRLYFGQIYVPGITSSMTAIRDLVSVYGSYDSQSPDKCVLRFIIPNIDTLPLENRYFSTHYIDDDYSDNGYWSHDDGTEYQCKNVGNAFINITIER